MKPYHFFKRMNKEILPQTSWIVQKLNWRGPDEKISTLFVVLLDLTLKIRKLKLCGSSFTWSFVRLTCAPEVQIAALVWSHLPLYNDHSHINYAEYLKPFCPQGEDFELNIDMGHYDLPMLGVECDLEDWDLAYSGDLVLWQ